MACQCAKCGGGLVIAYETIHKDLYKLDPDGRINPVKIGCKDSCGELNFTVYCQNCGTAYDGRFIDGKFVPYKEEPWND